MRSRLSVVSWLVLPVATLGLAVAPARAADSTCTITLGPRTACVTPLTNRQGRADGGICDVRLDAPNVLDATLTGTAAANAVFGCESSAVETFHLEQEFEVAGPEAGAREVAMTMESNLVGLVRSRHKAGASARVAAAKICPLGSPDTPLVLVHPPFEVSGTGGRLCNQRLTPIVVPAMPVGRYVLTADFVLTSVASGLVDDHSAADFSASTLLPTDWVRVRDPFQGVDKKDFGFKILLTVEPAKAGLAAALLPRGKDPLVAQTGLKAEPAKSPSRPVPRPAVLTGLDRHSTPR